MMTARKFHHSFYPSTDPLSSMSVVELTTLQIADAALLEIIQIAVGSLPFQQHLEQLLVQGDPWFRWIGQLGQIRETKTALSGLYGRFVARAYLTRHCGYHYFQSLNSQMTPVTFGSGLVARKNKAGDAPDWIIGTLTGNQIAIAEAKGSHNTAGASHALKAAIAQVNRVSVYAGRT